MILDKIKNMRDTTFKYKKDHSQHYQDNHTLGNKPNCCEHHRHHHTHYRYENNNSDLNYHPHYSDEDYHHHHHHNIDSSHNHHHNHRDHHHHHHRDYNQEQNYPSPKEYPLSQPPISQIQYYGTQSQDIPLNIVDENKQVHNNQQRSPAYYAHYHDKTVVTNDTQKLTTDPNYRKPADIKNITVYSSGPTTPEKVISPDRSIDELYENKHRFNYDNYIPISIIKSEPPSNQQNIFTPLTKSIEHVVYDQETQGGHSLISITDQEKVYFTHPSAPIQQNNISMHRNQNETMEGDNWYSDKGDMIQTESNYTEHQKSVDRKIYQEDRHFKSNYPLSDSSRESKQDYYNYSLNDSGFADKSDASLNQSRESYRSPLRSTKDYDKKSSYKDIEKEALNTTFEDLGTPSIFRARLDLTHFKRHEIDAKIIDDKIIVNAQHGERPDPDIPGGGVTKREFFTSYTLPPDCNPDKVRAYMSQNGYLTIECIRDNYLNKGTYIENVPIHIK